uniref:Uncharacterized protein n=1 Tax=Oryza punctata TaxID=4537 RepID=A0A0E0JXB7_ORYPU
MISAKQKCQMDEALLEQPAIMPAPEPEGTSLLTIIGFAFLTFNSAMAIYRSNRDVGAIAFVAFSYFDLLLLFYCLRLFERTEHGSPRRGQIKAAVWLLTTMLTAVFSYKVAAIMPLPVQVLVWAMAAIWRELAAKQPGGGKGCSCIRTHAGRQIAVKRGRRASIQMIIHAGNIDVKQDLGGEAPVPRSQFLAARGAAIARDSEPRQALGFPRRQTGQEGDWDPVQFAGWALVIPLTGGLGYNEPAGRLGAASSPSALSAVVSGGGFVDRLRPRTRHAPPPRARQAVGPSRRRDRRSPAVAARVGPSPPSVSTGPLGGDPPPLLSLLPARFTSKDRFTKNVGTGPESYLEKKELNLSGREDDQALKGWYQLDDSQGDQAFSGEVAYGRINGARKIKVAEVQRHHTATVVSLDAAHHASPLADMERLVATPRGHC